ncbi:MAG: SurA N-terminal domain [Chloroflexota bacterium]|jgi:hypothetical protein|nr:SurA N-terminal domain [Chloroflexota bacterium]
MSLRPVYALALVGGLALSGCSGPELPFLQKPAAQMDGHAIAMADYDTRLKLLKDDYNTKRKQDPATYPDLNAPEGKTNLEKLENEAIRELVDQVLLVDDAGKHNINVSDDDVNKDVDNARKDYESRAAQQQTQGQPTPPSFNDYLKQAGVTIDQVREQARARLAEQRLENSLGEKRATEALALVKAGTDIVEVAKKYSDEKEADRGAELSVPISGLDAGSLAPVKPVLTTLNPGETNQELTRGTDGFFIFKVTAKDAANIKVRYVFVRAPDAAFYHPDQRPQWFVDYLAELERAAHVKYNVAHLTNP